MKYVLAMRKDKLWEVNKLNNLKNPESRLFHKNGSLMTFHSKEAAIKALNDTNNGIPTFLIKEEFLTTQNKDSIKNMFKGRLFK